jgi:hypothetical protein
VLGVFDLFFELRGDPAESFGAGAVFGSDHLSVSVEIEAIFSSH